jgi:hypothetical protein
VSFIYVYWLDADGIFRYIFKGVPVSKLSYWGVITMSKYCPYCGVELREGAKFCSACGKKIGEQPATDGQSPSQQQRFTRPSSPQKSKKKKIIGISVIIIAIVILLLILFFLFGWSGSFSGADSRFVGEWVQDIGLGATVDWKFNNDKTLQTGSFGGAMYNVGTWDVKGDQLCLYNNAVCYTYEFSNNGNTLTLNIFGEGFGYPLNVVLTKKGQEEPNQPSYNRTPNLACTIDATTNRLSVAMTDANVYWNDIVITLDPAATWQVFRFDGLALAQTDTTATITTEVTAGDYIQLFGTTGDVRVTLRYTPTNSLLGTWTVNI